MGRVAKSVFLISSVKFRFLDHVGSATVGELFQKIIELQFTHFRNGDRFWYEHSSQFTDDEISALPFLLLRSAFYRPSLSRCLENNLIVIRHDPRHQTAGSNSPALP